MVWHSVSNSHKIMTALNVMLLWRFLCNFIDIYLLCMGIYNLLGLLRRLSFWDQVGIWEHEISIISDPCLNMDSFAAFGLGEKEPRIGGQFGRRKTATPSPCLPDWRGCKLLDLHVVLHVAHVCACTVQFCLRHAEMILFLQSSSILSRLFKVDLLVLMFQL